MTGPVHLQSDGPAVKVSAPLAGGPGFISYPRHTGDSNGSTLVAALYLAS